MSARAISSRQAKGRAPKGSTWFQLRTRQCLRGRCTDRCRNQACPDRALDVARMVDAGSGIRGRRVRNWGLPVDRFRCFWVACFLPFSVSFQCVSDLACCAMGAECDRDSVVVEVLVAETEPARNAGARASRLNRTRQDEFTRGFFMKSTCGWNVIHDDGRGKSAISGLLNLSSVLDAGQNRDIRAPRFALDVQNMGVTPHQALACRSRDCRIKPRALDIA